MKALHAWSMGGIPANPSAWITQVAMNLARDALRHRRMAGTKEPAIIRHIEQTAPTPALAVETAEAYAEMLHGQLRAQWGFPDAPEMTMMERFQAKYRGCRYSFGYPACPRLDDQAILWKLLRPEEIGVQLTDGFMMDPEASVSALVVQHPAAKYFGVGEGE